MAVQTESAAAPADATARSAERRPAIMVVDDEPAVLAAVARDLRRGFGERYRIMRAGSGGESRPRPLYSSALWNAQRLGNRSAAGQADTERLLN